MKITTKTLSLFLAGLILLSSCSSTTLIQSTPNGAKIYLNGEPVGKTPYTYTDTKIVGSKTLIKLEKEGYEPLNTTLSRNEEVDVGAIIGGIFVLVPFLWTMRYKPTHTYILTPIIDNNQPRISKENQQNTKSKADKLRELKQLLNEEIITQKEYESEKKKILKQNSP